MSRHNLSHALRFFFGGAQYGPYENALRGIEFHPRTFVNLGAGAAAAADNILNDATATDAAQVITTFLAQPDIPRCLVATGTAGSNHVILVHGRDAYGALMTEQFTLNGTNAITGVKAFASVHQVNVAVGAAGDTFDLGTTDKLGLPFRVADGRQVSTIYESGLPEVATLGTLVLGIDTAQTATSVDPRGTYDPSDALNGALTFGLDIRVDATSKETAFGQAHFYSGPLTQ